jgi:hypothetical protein
VSPLQKDAALSADKGKVFDRALLTLQDWGSEGGGSLVEVNAHGEKHTPEQDDWWTVDENDHELRSVIEGVLAGIVEKVGG